MTLTRPFVIVPALLALLTWLLIESRSPGQIHRTRSQEALQALLLEDAALNRAVLMTRAGLLLHYDSLPRIGRDARQQLSTLEHEVARLAGHDGSRVTQEARALSEAVVDKRRQIEHFMSDNAVLRNSATYFGYLMNAFDHSRSAGAASTLHGAHLVMRFLQSPASIPRSDVDGALARFAAGPGGTSRPIAAHARIVVGLRPQVDEQVRAILSVPVAARAGAVQQALLQSGAAAEARAQRFRLLLFASATVLLMYLVFLFRRLRLNAIELRRKEVQLIQANKMTALGTLVSSVAHEINNPNQVVLTNAGVLTNALEDVVDALDNSAAASETTKIAGLPYSEMRDMLPRLARDAEESARRIDAIVDDLKNFARPGGRSTDRFDLNQVVRRALRLLGQVVDKRTDSLGLHLSEPLPPVAGNPQQIEQVTVNLVVNALEALPARERGVTVTTSHDEASSCVVLEVQDEGVGMSRSQLARLGEAFFTTKDESGGTGLGVAIASSLVRLHNGQLDFASQPGRGTRATVRLPVAADIPCSRAPSS